MAVSNIEVPQLDNPYTQGVILPVLVDADLIAYQVAFSKEVDSEATAIQKTKDVVDYIKHNTQLFDVGQYHFYLTGRGNYRNDWATTSIYKGNRKKGEKPEWLDFARDFIKSEYSAIVVDGKEADDAIATHAAELDYNCIAAGKDKDFLQIPCWHYNTGRGVWYRPSEWDGLFFFYTQILMGDSTDAIVGLKGIGPVKAAKMLEGCTTVKELYNVCLEAYDGNTDRVRENGILLWLQRHEGEIWEPPK